MNRKDPYLNVRERIDEELDAIIEGGDSNRIDRLVEAAARNPTYPDLRYRLAHLYFLRGEPDAALAELDVATQINPDFIDALYLKANILSTKGRLEDALAVLRQIAANSEPNAETHYKAAVALGRLGRHAEAIEEAKKAVELNRGHQLAHAFLAEQYLCANEWESATTHYAAANRIRPHEDYCYLLALLNLKVGRTSAAEELLETALKLNPSHLNSCVRLAVLKSAEGDYERAYSLLRLAQEFYPKYPDLRYSLAKICLLLGRREEAYKLMQSALEINPRYAEVRREMGYLYSTRQMTSEAVDQLEQSLELDPDDEQTYLNLGFVYSNQGDHDRAIDVMEQAIKRFPDSWRLYHSLGIVHLQDKSFPKAKLSFLEAIKINPELESVQRSLRIVFQDESLLEDEKERLIRIYQAPNQKPELDHHLGLVYLDFHKEKAAASYFQRSLDAGYKRSLNAILLATVHANTQDYDSAVRVLEEAQTENLAETLRRLLLALFHANGGDHELAARFYQQVMTESPLLFHSVNRLCVCFREREELDDMLDDYLDYARFHERNGELFCRIAEIYANKGMLVEAKQHFHHATILDPNSARAHHAMGVLMMFRLDFTVAIDFFLRAVDREPDWPIPHLSLAMVYLSQSRHSLASVSLRRYVHLEGQTPWREAAAQWLERIKPPSGPVGKGRPTLAVST